MFELDLEYIGNDSSEIQIPIQPKSLPSRFWIKKDDASDLNNSLSDSFGNVFTVDGLKFTKKHDFKLNSTKEYDSDFVEANIPEFLMLPKNHEYKNERVDLNIQSCEPAYPKLFYFPNKNNYSRPIKPISSEKDQFPVIPENVKVANQNEIRQYPNDTNTDGGFIFVEPVNQQSLQFSQTFNKNQNEEKNSNYISIYPNLADYLSLSQRINHNIAPVEHLDQVVPINPKNINNFAINSFPIRSILKNHFERKLINNKINPIDNDNKFNLTNDNCIKKVQIDKEILILNTINKKYTLLTCLLLILVVVSITVITAVVIVNKSINKNMSIKESIFYLATNYTEPIQINAVLNMPSYTKDSPLGKNQYDEFANNNLITPGYLTSKLSPFSTKSTFKSLIPSISTLTSKKLDKTTFGSSTFKTGQIKGPDSYDFKKTISVSSTKKDCLHLFDISLIKQEDFRESDENDSILTALISKIV